MRKLLPIILVATIYLTPLYPIYAQNTASTASGPAFMKRPKAIKLEGEVLKNRGEALMTLDKDNIASRAAALKEKLSKFRNKAKANRIESINSNLNNLNKRWTSAMSKNLERMSKILEKLKAKEEEAAAAGKDVSALNSTIAEAEVAWAEADTALKAQLETDYSVTINTESTVKEDARTTRNSLQTDLKAAHTKIVEARKALGNAIQAAINSMQGGKNGAK